MFVGSDVQIYSDFFCVLPNLNVKQFLRVNDVLIAILTLLAVLLRFLHLFLPAFPLAKVSQVLLARSLVLPIFCCLVGLIRLIPECMFAI